MDNSIIKKAKEYIEKEKNEVFRNEIVKLLKENNEKELEDRFYTDLEFGTGGIRGIMNGGYNRINPYIVEKATQGFAKYILKKDEKDKNGELSVVISYDSRLNSKLFAECAALVFCANGIKTRIFSSLRPTPELSFAINYFQASGGIMITASHNPKVYNGYKAYWTKGIQVTPPHDKNIISLVNKVQDIKTIQKEEAIKKGLLIYIDQEVDNAFMKTEEKVIIDKSLFKNYAKDVKIVYTPLHGAGQYITKKTLEKLGVTLIDVEEQKDPNGNFPTTDYPNPEDQKVLDLAIKKADKTGATLVLAADPDADRLGMAAKDKNGKWIYFNGNQHGALLIHYILSTLKEKKKLSDKSFFANTIVTSELQNKIADKFGVENQRVLTGFKWLGKALEEHIQKDYQFIMATEESLGYLISDKIRDKDSVSAIISTIEVFLKCIKENTTLIEKLEEIYKEFSYHKEIQISKSFTGKEGKQIIENLMKNFREKSPSKFGSQELVKVVDIQESTIKYIKENKTEKNESLPKSNVLQFYLSKGSVLNIRPSGTEPKIKFYILACEKYKPSTEEEVMKIKIDLEKYIEQFK